MASDRQCRCGERARVRTSKRAGETVVQYLRCTCGERSKSVVPANQVWRRHR